MLFLLEHCNYRSLCGLVHGLLHRQETKSACCVQRTQRNIQIAHSSNSDMWTVLALDLAVLLAPVTSALVEETKAIQFCANMLVRGAFTADDSYTQQVSWVLECECAKDSCFPQPDRQIRCL